MQARAPLMIEHRLIEKVIAVARRMAEEIGQKSDMDPLRIDTVVDFIRTYADRTHHGKEEDILFRALEEKHLSAADQAQMDELIEEHVQGREVTSKLVAANARLRAGDRSALPEMAALLERLADFYPRHIAKEDQQFFPAARAYFSEEEDQELLAAFWEFDRKMIHEKYQDVLDDLEKQTTS